MRLKLIIGGRPIAFYPEFAEIFGSIERALYIQQLYYWSDKGSRSDGYFYKTKKEIEEETTISRYQQDSCRKYFEKIGILKTKLVKAKGAPTLHYFIDTQKFQKILDRHYLNSEKLANPIDRNSPIEALETGDSITETTTETTNIYKERNSKRKKATQVPQEFTPDEKLTRWAEEKGYTNSLDLNAETEAFIDFHRAKGTTYKDWNAAWRNWIRRAAQYKAEPKQQDPAYYKPLVVD